MIGEGGMSLVRSKAIEMLDKHVTLFLVVFGFNSRDAGARLAVEDA